MRKIVFVLLAALLAFVGYIAGSAINSPEIDSEAEVDISTDRIIEVSQQAKKHTLTAHKKRPVPEMVMFETETAAEIEYEAAAVEDGMTTLAEKQRKSYYSVNNCILDKDLQDYLRYCLRWQGIEWFMPISMAQIFQESKFDVNALNPNGLDMGLCQFRITYFDYYAKQAGMVTYDIWNPFDALYVYADLTARNLKEYGSIEKALSAYYTGGAGYSEEYVNDVMQWLETTYEFEEG